MVKVLSKHFLVIDQFLYALTTLLITSYLSVNLDAEHFASISLLITAAMIIVGYFRAIVNQPQAILFKNGVQYKENIPHSLITIVTIICLGFQLAVYGVNFLSLFPILIIIVQLSRDIYSVNRNFRGLFPFLFSYILTYLTLVLFGELWASKLIILYLLIYASFTIYLLSVDPLIWSSYVDFFLRTFYFSKFIFMSNTLFLITSSVIPFFLDYKFSSEATRIYYIYMSVLAVFNPLVRALNLRFMYSDERTLRINSKFILIVLFSLPLVAATIVGIQFVFYREFSHNFDVLLIGLMSLYIGTRLIYFVVDLNFNINKKNKILLLVSSVRLIPLVYLALANTFILQLFAMSMLVASLLEVIILRFLDDDKIAFNF